MDCIAFAPMGIIQIKNKTQERPENFSARKAVCRRAMVNSPVGMEKMGSGRVTLPWQKWDF